MLTLRIGIAAVCLMVSLPFLVPIHTAPIPTFHAEWVAAALGLAAGLALLGARRLPLPGAALLALALAAVAALQATLGRAPIPQLTEMFALYLLWAALVACAASHIAHRLGLAKLTKMLATAVLIGSILAALASLSQPLLKLAFGWMGFGPDLGGPLGQRNHFVDYLWLGLASALYLHSIETLPRAAFWPVAVLLTLSAALAGQRSSFLYAAALVTISFWQARAGRSMRHIRTLRVSLGIGALFLLMQPVAAVLPGIVAYEGTPPPAMRALNEFASPSVRLQLAGLAVNGAANAPLLGHGIGSFPGLALAFADEIAPEDNPGPAEHSHNVLLDLAAELGLPAVTLVLLGAIAWVRALSRRTSEPEADWALYVAAILGLHSMIEYPLWHAYFLGLLAVVAGAFCKPREVGGRLASVALTLGLVAWSGIGLFSLMHDYQLLETALALGKESRAMPASRAALLSIPSRSLLSPWVNTAACVSLDPLRVPLADGLAVCNAAMAFAPTVESAVNMAALRWRYGDVEGARELLRRIRRTLPMGPITDPLTPLRRRDVRLSKLGAES